ncbi:MAG: poly-gamma-glutamate system protein [Candidatus Cloacimonadales bacterium]
MFIPSAKSKLSLILLFFIALLLFIWVEGSTNYVKEDHFELKMKAAQEMQNAAKVLKQNRIDSGAYIDNLNDPNKTALVGDRESVIITDRGNLTSKLTSLNPNMAAVVVDFFKNAELKAGDKVAVSYTGSFPGMNLALFSAAKVMDLDLKIVSSVGASMFGATDPDFTWLDMEKVLNDSGVFPYHSSAASIGGGRDLGRGLSLRGRELILDAIERNNVTLINGSSLEDNIAQKMFILDELAAGDEYKLYVNIGGGLSSLGTTLNGQMVSPGLHRYLKLKNIPTKGTMFLFAERGVKLLHLLDIVGISNQYEMPVAPEPLPQAGMGKVFEAEKYSISITIISLVILLILIAMVIFFDHHELKIKKDEINV